MDRQTTSYTSRNSFGFVVDLIGFTNLFCGSSSLRSTSQTSSVESPRLAQLSAAVTVMARVDSSDANFAIVLGSYARKLMTWPMVAHCYLLCKCVPSDGTSRT